MSDNKRNETQLVCDVLGLESLVDEISSTQLRRGNESTPLTPAAILGPFYRADAPVLPNGSSIVKACRTSPWYASAAPYMTHVSGRVLDSNTGTPVPNAVVDVWQAGPNGMYEQQDPDQPDMNLRGRFVTDQHGRYTMICLRPTAYPIPWDGPAGKLLQLLDRHPYRPAHIHFIVSACGYRTLTTQIFDRDDKYCLDDAVFAVKDELMVTFKPHEDHENDAKWTLEYDISLGRGELR